MKTIISIYANGIWAGSGDLRDGTIENCPAVLGADQDASDAAYEAVEDAIANGDDSVVVGGITFTWSVEPAA